MKYKGKKKNISTEGVVKLPRPNGKHESFRITALPLGYDEVLDKMFPPATPPSHIAMSKKGKILRDDTGRPVRDVDYDDPVFRAESSKIASMRMAYIIKEALKEQKDWTFETKQTDNMSNEDYYLALFTELKSSGFSPGDCAILTDGILRISNMDSDAMEEARSDF